uniref:EOG090X0ARF n=1 Tax=Daphnia lumholtzi TaxID=42856 RepID=A0A4Y7MAI4_9CRUS|nr:EOG090X0ARF [Daphnia lumholtzi]
MPVENLEHEGLAKNPNLELAQYKFYLTLDQHKNDASVKQKLMDAIRADDMAPFYEEVCKELNWTVDAPLLSGMKERNEAKLKALDVAIEDAEQNLGEMEVRESNLKKAEFLCLIGNKDAALSAFRKTYDKTVSLGHRLDIIFHNIRIGLFYMDHDLVTRNIDRAKSLIEEGGDWDRRNRLKVYQGLYSMVIRDFKAASGFFLDTVSTFTSYELMEYSTFVRYTVYMGMIALPRNQLRDKIVRGSEILEVLHSLSDVKDYLFSMYNCLYADFFVNLAKVELAMSEDRHLASHYRFYVREMRIQVKSSGRGRGEPLIVSDEDSQPDTVSVVSSVSDNRSVLEEGGETDERTQVEILEDKLKEFIDLTTQKSSQGRVNSFNALCQAFSAKYMPDFVAGRRMTLLDCAERGMKKGKGAEQESAAKLMALLCLQLGSVADSESIYRDHKTYLLSLMADKSASPAARAQVCSTFGLCAFLADCDLSEIVQVMIALESIFSTSLRAPENTVTSPDVLRLHSAALSAWSLLLTLLPPRHIYDLSQTHIRRLVQLLDSTDVDLRIGAGEAIALIYEGARVFDEDFGFDISSEEETDDHDGIQQMDSASRHTSEMDELCTKLKQLATDSHKYRAKKDRKQQRSSFRDILHAIEENEAPDVRIKFGKETLDIDSWGCKHQYDSFCQLLGSGMNLHLAQNDLLREIFSLGNPLLDNASNAVKIKKLERHHMNMAAFKARSLTRGKNRDKRTAVF